jgi:rare lipoprotein A
VRRLAFFIAALLMLSACGGKKARVSVSPVSTASTSPSNSDLEGLASYYAEPYHGRRTANGEVFDTYKAMTAAHRTLPFNTLVRVTNKTSGGSVEVRINDRGPFIDGRVIDLSLLAAQKLEMVRAGIVSVKLEILKTGDNAGVPVASPSSPSSNSPSAPIYGVQVGAFGNKQSAEDLKSRLEKKYPSVSIETFSADAATIYRVRIGRQADLQAAQRLADELRKEDFSPFIVRMN